MKKFISGAIAGVILTVSTSAFAATMKTINASYNVNKLVVNGVDTGKGSTAFISGGTTYVPLRTISDALGQSINWDSATKTIYINSSSTGGATLEEPTDIPSVNNNSITTPAITAPATNPATNRKFISEEQAKNAAIKAVGGGKVIYIKSDLYDMDDIPDYDVKVMKGGRIYEVEINALTGAVIDFDIDD